MCSLASDYDSRGPGWYCCHKCNRYNEMNREICIECGVERCKELKD
jgi:hypothetical protein